MARSNAPPPLRRRLVVTLLPLWGRWPFRKGTGGRGRTQQQIRSETGLLPRSLITLRNGFTSPLPLAALGYSPRRSSGGRALRPEKEPRTSPSLRSGTPPVILPGGEHRSSGGETSYVRRRSVERRRLPGDCATNANSSPGVCSQTPKALSYSRSSNSASTMSSIDEDGVGS